MLLAALLGVVGFHDFLADIATAGHVVEALSPGWVVQEPAKSVANLVLAPFEVMDAVFLDVADGDDLDIRAGEDSADLADRLGSEADAGQGDLLAGRDESRAAQYMSRHDREGRRRRTSSQHELAARQAAWMRRRRVAGLVGLAGPWVVGFHSKARKPLMRRDVSGRPPAATALPGADAA